ncbi:hypothetical protein CAEBREN_25267 [Caenorhabditis brenneri]|uniref:CUB domain-containing protein n=1 Tax=Caenorhabditis brenneri TaxID=135651 RepID=G0M6M2_CAEBE|nr:hypothetical protein CAEBREN_25267 [Caenorhabditis brenneri]
MHPLFSVYCLTFLSAFLSSIYGDTCVVHKRAENSGSRKFDCNIDNCWVKIESDPKRAIQLDIKANEYHVKVHTYYKIKDDAEVSVSKGLYDNNKKYYSGPNEGFYLIRASGRCSGWYPAEYSFKRVAADETLCDPIVNYVGNEIKVVQRQKHKYSGDACQCNETLKFSHTSGNYSEFTLHSPGYPNFLCPLISCDSLISFSKLNVTDGYVERKLVFLHAQSRSGISLQLKSNLINVELNENSFSTLSTSFIVDESDLEVTYKTPKNLYLGSDGHFRMVIKQIQIRNDCVCSIFNRKLISKNYSKRILIPYQCDTFFCDWTITPSPSIKSRGMYILMENVHSDDEVQVWNKQMVETYFITLQMTDFDVENFHDELYIYNGNSNNSALIRQYERSQEKPHSFSFFFSLTGKHKDLMFTSTGSSMLVDFISDDQHSKRGFHFVATAVSTTTGLLFTSSSSEPNNDTISESTPSNFFFDTLNSSSTESYNAERESEYGILHLLFAILIVIGGVTTVLAVFWVVNKKVMKSRIPNPFVNAMVRFHNSDSESTTTIET